MEHKLLTIVTVCYNSEKTIKRAIASVLSQINNNTEYIIVDGDSTDNTLSIIKSFDTKKIKLISEKDSGIYDAMNKGLAHSSGKWIYFLNSDDWLVDNILPYIENVLLSNDKYEFIYGGTLIHRNYKGRLLVRRFPCASITGLDKTKETMQFPHQGLFVKRIVFDQIGGFDLSFPIASDWDFILRGYLKKYRFYKINKLIANFSYGGLSYKSHIMERHRVRKKNKAVKYFDMYMLYDVKHLIKKIFLKCFFPKAFEKFDLEGFRPVRDYQKDDPHMRGSSRKIL